MNKEFEIFGLSSDPSGLGRSVVVISELYGNEKIPIIVKSSDAVNIYNVINGKDIKSGSNIYDVVKRLTDDFLINLDSIEMYDIVEGIFYNRLRFSNQDDEISVDCTTGDLLMIACVYGLPIMVSDKVYKQYSLTVNDDGTVDKPKVVDKKQDDVYVEKDLDILNNMIDEALSEEDYEKAANLRDQIELMKSSEDKDKN